MWLTFSPLSSVANSNKEFIIQAMRWWPPVTTFTLCTYYLKHFYSQREKIYSCSVFEGGGKCSVSPIAVLWSVDHQRRIEPLWTKFLKSSLRLADLERGGGGGDGGYLLYNDEPGPPTRWKRSVIIRPRQLVAGSSEFSPFSITDQFCRHLFFRSICKV